tara:strand:- start:4164 stop:4376 length:213 start_codon:yes stop_codon:yes gene_type:complete
MKTLINLVDLLKECVQTIHKVRGRICLVCFLILGVIFSAGTIHIIDGVIDTINNLINKPIKADIKIDKSK